MNMAIIWFIVICIMDGQVYIPFMRPFFASLFQYPNGLATGGPTSVHIPLFFFLKWNIWSVCIYFNSLVFNHSLCVSVHISTSQKFQHICNWIIHFGIWFIKTKISHLKLLYMFTHVCQCVIIILLSCICYCLNLIYIPP